MATKKQIAANRRKARKSTGPRSEAGKARVSRNATTHGLTGRSPVLPDESREEFTAFAAGMLADLAPLGTLEVALAARVADGMWRLLRIGRIEAACLARELAAAADRAARLREIPGLPHCAALGEEHTLGEAFLKLDAEGLPNSLARYEAALQRGVERSLKLLQETQAPRRAAQELAPRNKLDSSAAQSGQGSPGDRPAGPGEDYAALAAALAAPALKPPKQPEQPKTQCRTGGLAPSSAASAAREAGAQFKADFPAGQAGQGFPGTPCGFAANLSESCPDASTTCARYGAGGSGTDAATAVQAARRPAAQIKAKSPAIMAGQGRAGISPNAGAAGEAPKTDGLARDTRQVGKAEGGADEPEPTRVPFPADEPRTGHREAGQDVEHDAWQNGADFLAAKAGQGSQRPRAVRYRQLPPFPACKVGGY